jgi:hypothetical protein
MDNFERIIPKTLGMLFVLASLFGCASGSEVSRDVTKGEVEQAIAKKLKAIDDDATLSPEQKKIARDRVSNPGSSAVAPNGDQVNLRPDGKTDK